MMTSVDSTAADTGNDTEFSNSDGKAVTDEVKAKLGSFKRIWKAISFV